MTEWAGKFSVDDGPGTEVRHFDTRAEAEEYAASIGEGPKYVIDQSKRAGRRVGHQPGFTITDALREKALAGLPLFSRPAEPSHEAAIRQALAKATASNAYTGNHTIMPVAPEAVAQAAQHGLDIAGYRHTIDGSAITHSRKKHGNVQVEAARGQLGITDADFLAIPASLAAPDAVAYGAYTSHGLPLIVSLKRLADGSLLVLEEQRTGRRALALTSMRKYPATTHASSVWKTLGLNARNDGGSTSLIIVEAPPALTPGDGTPPLFSHSQAAISRQAGSAIKQVTVTVTDAKNKLVDYRGVGLAGAGPAPDHGPVWRPVPAGHQGQPA